MSQSGSRDWTLTGDNILTEALEMCLAIGHADTAAATMLTSARRTANIIIKAWQQSNIFLNSREWTQKTFTASSEVVGSDGLNYTCIKNHTSASNNKPITGANYSSFWTQKGTSGSAWVTATSYSAIGEFALSSDVIAIEKAFMRDGGKDYPVEIVNFNRFAKISDKSRTGRPYLLLFDKQLTPNVYLYYQPQDTDMVLHYMQIKKLQDIDAANDNADLTEASLQALITNIAYKLSFKYNTPTEVRLNLKDDAKTEFKKLKRENQEIDEAEFLKPSYSARITGDPYYAE